MLIFRACTAASRRCPILELQPANNNLLPRKTHAMFKFLSGCAVTAVAFYVFANHPELVHRAIDAGKEQLTFASRNVSALASGDNVESAAESNEPTALRVTAIDYDRVSRLVPTMKGESSDDLWGVMDEDDYDRRASAAQILLGRARIPVTPHGVAAVQQKYLRSSQPESLQTGFSYLGLLALQPDAPDDSIVRLAQGYVERHPRDQACDNALWALGELGSQEMVPYFFQVIDDERKYGTAARERAFCCLAQCGRYSQSQRLEMVPSFLQVYDQNRDAQTRAWTMQALAHCAPGVRARSIDDWRNWWSRQ